MVRSIQIAAVVPFSGGSVVGTAFAQITECPTYGDGSISYLTEQEPTWIQDYS